MRKVLIVACVIALAAILAGGTCIAGVPASISYQGKLTNTLGQPVSDGAYQVQFKLYVVSTVGTPFWTSAVQSVTTSGGVFTTQLSTLAASDLAGKTDVWMEIWVGTPLVALSPRTKFASVPYALISGDSWSLLGNAGTTPATNFIGTTDNQPLEFKVNNTRGFRLEPTSDTPNIIGGYSGNTVTAGVYGATISGGGAYAYPSSVTSSYGTVGGGAHNTASGPYSAVGGGIHNTASSSYATVGGGYNNHSNAYHATVGGGNQNTASGTYATIGGGFANTALGTYSVAAGQRAKANHDGTFVWADSTFADFASTATNQFLIRASGGVGIGTASPTNALSVAGSGDVSVKLTVGASAPNYTNRLDVVGGDNWDLTNTEGDVRIGNASYRLKMGVALGGGGAGAVGIRAVGGVNMLVLGSGTNEVMFVANNSVGIGTSSPTYKLHVNGSVAGVGAYNQLSDLRYKTNIETISNSLDKVMRLRGVNFDWRKSEYPELAFGDGRQVGFVAQEIAQVLPEVVSKDNKGIYSVAYGSVVPVLVEALKEQQRTIESQQKQIDEIKALVAALVSKQQEKP